MRSEAGLEDWRGRLTRRVRAGHPADDKPAPILYTIGYIVVHRIEVWTAPRPAAAPIAEHAGMRRLPDNSTGLAPESGINVHAVRGRLGCS